MAEPDLIEVLDGIERAVLLVSFTIAVWMVFWIILKARRND